MAPDPRRLLARRVYYGWVVVGACLLASMAVFGTSYAFSVFYDAFIDEFDASRTALAVAFGLQTALIYVGGVVAGRAVDAYGQRLVAAGSSVLLVAGLGWTALARSYLELLAAFGVVAALGMAGLYVVGYATVPLWFRRRRGTAAGIASAGLGVGLVVVPPGADALITTVGWRGAMGALAAGVGIVCALVVLLFADDPDDIGADRSVEFGEVDGGATETASGTDGPIDPQPVRETLGSLPFRLVFLGWVLTFVPMYVVFSHVVLHTADAGIGRSTGVLAITVIGVTTGASRLGIGLVADRVGRTGTFVACAAVMGTATAALAPAPSTAIVLAVAAVFGVGYGGCGGLLGAQIADLFGEHELNTLFAVASLSFAVSGLAAPPLAGVVFETVGGYAPALVGAGLCGVAGAGCVAVAGRIATAD